MEEITRLREEVADLRLAVSSLLDVVQELAHAQVHGDRAEEPWAEVVDNVWAGHRHDLNLEGGVLGMRSAVREYERDLGPRP